MKYSNSIAIMNKDFNKLQKLETLDIENVIYIHHIKPFKLQYKSIK